MFVEHKKVARNGWDGIISETVTRKARTSAENKPKLQK